MFCNSGFSWFRNSDFSAGQSDWMNWKFVSFPILRIIFLAKRFVSKHATFQGITHFDLKAFISVQDMIHIIIHKIYFYCQELMMPGHVNFWRGLLLLFQLKRGKNPNELDSDELDSDSDELDSDSDELDSDSDEPDSSDEPKIPSGSPNIPFIQESTPEPKSALFPCTFTEMKSIYELDITYYVPMLFRQGWSTFAITDFSWLSAHVIYLKLREKKDCCGTFCQS